LQGSIDLAKLVFRTNVLGLMFMQEISIDDFIRYFFHLGRNIDIVARAALWKSGLG
jgi:hypothetical protein